MEGHHVRDARGGCRNGAGRVGQLHRHRCFAGDAAWSVASPARQVRYVRCRVVGGRRWSADEMNSSFAAVLDTLTRLRGVRASLIVSERDGVIVDSSLRFGQDGDRIAALAASMY